MLTAVLPGGKVGHLRGCMAIQEDIGDAVIVGGEDGAVNVTITPIQRFTNFGVDLNGDAVQQDQTYVKMAGKAFAPGLGMEVQGKPIATVGTRTFVYITRKKSDCNKFLAG